MYYYSIYNTHRPRALIGRCNDSIEVDSAAGRAVVGDRGRAGRDLAIDGDDDVSSAAIEGHLDELHPRSDGEVLAGAADPDRDGDGGVGGRDNEDAVADAVLSAALGA